MALTLRTDGSAPANIVSSSWWNDYYNLLTGVMTDQPVTLNYRPGTGSTPTLTLKTDGRPLIKGFKSDNTTQAFQVDQNGNLAIAGGATANAAIQAVLTAASTANTDSIYIQRLGAFGTGQFLFGIDSAGALYCWDNGHGAYVYASATNSSISFAGNIQSGGFNVPRLNPTIGTAGRNIFLGTNTPTGAAEGDIWIKA